MSIKKDLQLYLKISNFFCLTPPLDNPTKSFVIRALIAIIINLLIYCYTAYWYYKFTGFSIKIGVITLATIINIFTISTSATINLKKFTEIFNKIDVIDSIFKSRFNAITPKFRRSIIYFILIKLYLLGMIIIDIYTNVVLRNIPEVLPSKMLERFQLQLIAVMVLLKYSVLSSIRSRLELLCKQMSSLCSILEDENITWKLDVVGELHNKLCDCIGMFNDMFGWHTLLIFVNIFMNILTIIYFAVVSNGKESDDSIYSFYLIASCVLLFGQGIGIIYISESISDGHYESIKIAYLILNRYLYNQELRQKSLALAQQISTKSATITAAGFFDINYAFLFTLINLFATYTVVIVQLNPS